MKEVIPMTGTVSVPTQVAQDFLELLVAFERWNDSPPAGLLNAVLGKAKLCRQHLDLFGSDIDPGFGVDPKDSGRLLELRQAIDTHLGWSSHPAEQQGDYVARVREVGEGWCDPKVLINTLLLCERPADFTDRSWEHIRELLQSWREQLP